MVDADWLAALRRFRQEHRLTQRELAVFLGVNQKTISRWERGIDQPNPETRDRLKSVLGDGGAGAGLPDVYETVRNAPIPIALVDDRGNVLAASRTYGHPQAASPMPGRLGTPTILVIEDDAAVLKATRAVLRRWQFLSVGATDGEAALALVADGGVQPTAAIIDFLLPGALDGVDTAAALRRALPDLPILIVSGEVNLERMAKITASGLPFIRKPVAPAEIRTVLTAMLGQNRDDDALATAE